MKTKKELCPKIYKTKDGRYQIHLWYKNKRYRFANGSAIEENLMPNLLEEPERGNMAFLMCSAFQLAIAKGWRPTDKKKEAAVGSVLSLRRTAYYLFLRSYKKSYNNVIKTVTML